MFMRFVQVKLKLERILEYIHVYEDVIIPVLEKTQGCRYAALVQNVNAPDEGISLTLWDGQRDAEAYERSGLYQELVDRSKPYFSDSSEWKVQLSKDLELQYGPVPSAPVVKRYSDESGAISVPFMENRSSSLYLRIVSLKVDPSKIDEFKSIYNHEIIPELTRVPGCRHCFLTQSVRRENEVLSVTIWDSLQDAQRYEAGGEFGVLLEKIKHTLSGLYQWKMQFEGHAHAPGGDLPTEGNHAGKAVTSDDLSVNAYSLVIGKTFR